MFVTAVYSRHTRVLPMVSISEFSGESDTPEPVGLAMN
jgi:hypothetical protein